MAKSIFLEKEAPPSPELLRGALGDTYALWQDLLARAKADAPGLLESWKYYGRAWGWCLALMKGKKNLCYLTPGQGSWQLSLSFDDRARAAVRESNLPGAIKEAVEAARQNTAGRTMDVTVSNRAELETALALLDIKGGS